MITRRSFLSTYSLGGAAFLLSPLINGLIREAHGQPQTRQLSLFYVFGTGFHPDWEFTPEDMKGKPASLDGPTAFQWPTAFAPLERYRNRVLLVDGLKNDTQTDGHLSGYAALSCVVNRDLPIGMKPLVAAGISIDQHVAQTLGKGTQFPSVRFGLHGSYWAPLRKSVFAYGKDQPAEHVQDPLLLHKTLFAKVTGSQDPMQNKSDTLLLDTIKGQIKSVQTRLAGPEREKLGLYLSTIEGLEKRMSSGLKCSSVPVAPAAATNTNCHASECTGPKVPEDALESMMNMSLIAAVCGMTNVICVSDAAPGSHGEQTRFKRIAAGTQFASQGYVSQPDHEGETLGKPMRQIVRRYQTSVLAEAIRVLSGIKVGDKTLFDQSTMLFMSENADDHHADRKSWPLLLIGNAGGKLRVDGRYLKYSNRAVGDLFSTLATGLGRPTNDFGAGGYTKVQGVLSEILA